MVNISFNYQNYHLPDSRLKKFSDEEVVPSWVGYEWPLEIVEY